MNRLIIVGNGFDIAHGLKTKYSDFIDHYWKNVENSSHNDEFFSFKEGFVFDNCNSLVDVVKHYENSSNYQLKKKQDLSHFFNRDEIIIKVHNDFFCRINERYNDAHWVDIEMEYFSSLKRILNRNNSNASEDHFEETCLRLISKLNNDLQDLAEAFEKYLISVVVPNIPAIYNDAVNDIFNDIDLRKRDMEFFFREFPKNFSDKILKPKFENIFMNEDLTSKYEETLILNFNYTNSVERYVLSNKHKFKIINIHGELGYAKNPINLGFGDERDNFYSEIENFNQNEYLRFMKSFSYSKTINYKNLFDFIEERGFQVQILGHSCGLSDRTLLNAIFEHANCKSIKVFFHQYPEMKDSEIDNYSDIVKNISRHFTQKRIMRDKIVNKTNCEQLPQKT